MRRRRGFTIIELMTAIALVGILAAVALPRFVDFQQRSRRAEAPVNVDGILTALVAWSVAETTEAPAATTSGGTPTPTPTPTPTATATPTATPAAAPPSTPSSTSSPTSSPGAAVAEAATAEAAGTPATAAAAAA